MSRLTQVQSRPTTPDFAYGPFTLCGAAFQLLLLSGGLAFLTVLQPRHRLRWEPRRFGLLRVRSPLLTQSRLLSFPPGTEMFQFPGLASALRPMHGSAPCGFPHSDIRASMGICPWARLFAACHVLLRLREPRHPSCALVSFLFSFRL